MNSIVKLTIPNNLNYYTRDEINSCIYYFCHSICWNTIKIFLIDISILSF